MVFTCNNCGARLEKKNAGTHVWKCCPLALTCMNCDKIFLKNEYVAHSNCVRKVEKLKPKRRKLPWKLAVSAVLKAPGITPDQKRFVGSLARLGSRFPRKKKIFMKFACRFWRDSFLQTDVVRQVFSLMEIESKKIKGLAIKNGNGIEKSSVDLVSKLQELVSGILMASVAPGLAGHQSSLVDTLVQHSNVEELEKKFKTIVRSLWTKSDLRFKNLVMQLFSMIELEMNNMKKKNDIKIVDVLKGEVSEETPDIVIEATTSKKSKKKRKRQEEEAVEEINEDGAGATVEEDTTSKKSKKKKHKKREKEAEGEITENGNKTEVVEGGTTSKKTHKKKHKSQEEEAMGNLKEMGNETEVLGGGETKGTTSKKSKKKNHKRQEEEAVTREINMKGNGEAGEKAEVGADITCKKTKKKKHKDQELPLEEEEVPKKKSKKSKQFEGEN